MIFLAVSSLSPRSYDSKRQLIIFAADKGVYPHFFLSWVEIERAGCSRPLESTQNRALHLLPLHSSSQDQRQLSVRIKFQGHLRVFFLFTKVK